jgi:PEP-CTERM motif
MNIRIASVTIIMAVLATVCGQAFAQPLPGEVAKFVQLPLNGGLPVGPPTTGFSGTPAPFPGHDELSTAWVNPQEPTTGYVGQYQADDFADNLSTPVVDVQWWGSYMNQSTPGTVPAFDITFESDVPGSPASGPSHPGSPLLNQIVTKVAALAPASGTFTETALPVAAGNPDGNLYLYNAELKVPFAEAANTVYWLKIVALDPTHTATDSARIQWGWHDRDWGLKDLLASPVPVPGENDESIGTTIPGPVWHFQDDAVGGSVSITAGNPPSPGATASVLQTGFTPEDYVTPYDGPPGSVPLSKDLAFVLYTVPEPASVMLFGLGAAALAITGCRRRRIR